MKAFLILILTLISSFSYAALGTDPIIPWPTSVREKLFMNDIEGSWVAFSHNTTWFIEIHHRFGFEDSPSIVIKSPSLFTNKGEGFLKSGQGLFWGLLVMDNNHQATILIYKDSEGTKLRMVDSPSRFHDMSLIKIEENE